MGILPRGKFRSLPPRNHFYWISSPTLYQLSHPTIEIIVIKLGRVTASDMIMHHAFN